jgi:DNA-binding transcriptional LysR family regulator
VDLIDNGLCHQITDEEFQPILAVARLTVRNTASLLGLAQAGVGLTLLLQLVALPGFGDLSFLPLCNALVRWSVWMILPPRPLAPPAVHAFATMVERQQIADEDAAQPASVGSPVGLTVGPSARPITGQVAEQCRGGRMV